MVRSLWETDSNCIIDVRAMDHEAVSYVNKDTAKVSGEPRTIEGEEEEEVSERMPPATSSFSPFVISTDVLLGVEAKNLLK